MRTREGEEVRKRERAREIKRTLEKESEREKARERKRTLEKER